MPLSRLALEPRMKIAHRILFGAGLLAMAGAGLDWGIPLARRPPLASWRRLQTLAAHRSKARVRVRGIVTLIQPWNAVVIQTRHRGIYGTGAHLQNLHLCQQVTLTGIPTLYGKTTLLRKVSARPGLQSICPPPLQLRQARDLTGRLMDMRVQFTARLVGIEINATDRAQFLNVLMGRTNISVEAAYPAARRQLSGLRLGSLLRLTGVYYIHYADGARRIQLELARARDLQILEVPSWWTMRRLTRAGAGLLAILFLIAIWNLTLRLQVRRQTRKLSLQHDTEVQLEQQLAQAKRLEAVGRLAGGVAHDFNNLLTVILGHAELLRMQCEDARMHPALDQIVDAGRRAARLTAQLLAYGRQQKAGMTALDLSQLIHGMQDILRSLLPENIQINYALDPGLWPVRADGGQLEQVLMNLAANARDAMPGAGEFKLTAVNLRLAAEEAADYMHARPGNYVCLSVSDTGTGMPPEILEKIFDPFFTTKAPSKGTGLGLASVHGIVVENGGALRVWSQPGRGTRFDILLPRYQEAGVREAAAAG